MKHVSTKSAYELVQLKDRITDAKTKLQNDIEGSRTKTPMLSQKESENILELLTIEIELIDEVLTHR